MAATIRRLRTRPDQANAAQADLLRQAVLNAPPGLLPPHMATQVIAALDRKAPSEKDWFFVQVNSEQYRGVVRWLRHNSRSPLIAMELWAELFQHLRFDTQEIAATREELAQAVGTSPGEVSRLMGELEGIGAISKKRERIAGMRGPGRVCYFLNPLVGTHLSGSLRDKAQEAVAAPNVLPFLPRD